MQISDSLEVAIGLSFVFFLSSLVLASIHEAIESVLKTRGKRLFDGIVEMLAHPDETTPEGQSATVLSGRQTAHAVYQHPLIRGLMRGDIAALGRFRLKLPSYLPSRTFALALIDQAASGRLALPEQIPAHAGAAASGLAPMQQLRLTVEGIQNAQVRGARAHAIDTARGDFDTLRANLEHWFDSAMDRVSGAYKRRSQRIIFGLGLVMALALNVNTLIVADALSKSASLRKSVVAQVEAVQASCRDKPCATGSAPDPVAALDKTSVPVGWNETAIAAVKRQISGQWCLLGLIGIAAGYLLTAFSVTLGAPFWFDVLNRLMVIRATVKPAEKSASEAPKDPQSTTSPVTVNVSQQAPPAPPGAPALPIDRDIYATPPDPAERQFEDDAGAPVPGYRAP